MSNFGDIKKKIYLAYSKDILNNTDKFKNLFENYLQTIKSSNILMIQYLIYENFNKNNMDYNESVRFIDSNIKALSKYSKKEILDENKKISKYGKYLKNTLDENTKKLNSAIDNFINESILKKVPNINILHESTNVILDQLTSKPILNESSVNNIDVDSLYKVIRKKITENLSDYDQDDIEIINAFLSEDENKKKEVFNSYREKTKISLEANKENISESVLNQTINFIDELSYKKESFINDINKLFEIKNI